jgi:hypothetical protein
MESTEKCIVENIINLELKVLINTMINHSAEHSIQTLIYLNVKNNVEWIVRNQCSFEYQK